MTKVSNDKDNAKKGNAPSPLRDRILSMVDVQEEEVTVPEWGGLRVICRGMTGRERSEYFKLNADGREMWEYTPTLIVMCVLDPDSREPIFEDGDVEALANKSGAALDRLAKVVSRLSGFGQEADEEMKDAAEQFRSGD